MTCTVTAASGPGTGTAPDIPAPTLATPTTLPTGATLPRPVEAEAVIPVVSMGVGVGSRGLPGRNNGGSPVAAGRRYFSSGVRRVYVFLDRPRRARGCGGAC